MTPYISFLLTHKWQRRLFLTVIAMCTLALTVQFWVLREQNAKLARYAETNRAAVEHFCHVFSAVKNNKPPHPSDVYLAIVDAIQHDPDPCMRVGTP